MKIISELFVLFIAIIILSCDNSSKAGYDSDSQRIIGTWNWVRTTGGSANVEETPATKGYDMQRVFEKTGNASNYIILKGIRTLTSSYRYRFSDDRIIFGTNSQQDEQIIFIYSFPSDNKLIMNHDVAGGLTFEYTRD